jgi:hypothetical protein
MMTKPPGFASSSTLPLDDEEESIDESLDEILLEANERPPENSVKSLEAVPSALASDEDSDADSVPAPIGEVTVLAPRPTFFDEVREEETKVDPYETAIRAAASRDDGLTSQASQQRDRALRKSASQPRLPTTRAAHDESDVEFEDAEAEDSQEYGASLSGNIGERTPADMPVAEDASPPSGFLSGGASGGFSSRLPPPMRSAPPPGRPDIYPGRRIPTPSSTSNTNDFLPLPTGGFGSGSHYPSIAIPAPVAPDTSSARVAALTDNRVRLPAAGLAGFLVTAFGGGLLIGALLWRGHAASPPPIQQLPVAAHTAPAIITEPVQPIVKPVPPPAPEAKAAPEAKPAPTAAAAATPPPTPSMPTMAAEASPTPAVAETPPAPKPAKKASGTSSLSSRARKFSIADEDAILNGQDPTPPPPPAPKAKKKKAAWTDPFAQ